MMMSPISSDDMASYLPRGPLPPPTSVELHHQLPLQHHHQQQQQQQRRWKPSSAGEVAPNCPRCDSPNTKFCYYNNYSLAQPRYFCKGCRRYWTKGGSLRNVPVGGGCRKNRRGRSSSSSSMRVHGDSRGRAEQTGQQLGNSAGMLEDIAGSGGNNAAAAASSTTSSSGGTSRASEGSDIDLAVLYAKYLSDQSSEHESSPESQQMASRMELPAAAADAGAATLDVEPTAFEFDYAALGHHQLRPNDVVDASDPYGTSSVISSSEAAQLHDLGFDDGVGAGQFQFLMPETVDGLSSGVDVDEAFWVNSTLPIVSSSGNSTTSWLHQQQCPGEQFILPMIPDQQTDTMMGGGPLAHNQSMLLGSGGSSWAVLDPWSIDAMTRL